MDQIALPLASLPTGSDGKRVENEGSLILVRNARMSTNKTPTTTIVVPCFNEEERLNRFAFQNYALKSRDVRFVFVNDGSTDHTSELLHRIASHDSNRFEVLDLSINSGKGEAVRAGLLHGIEIGSRLVGYWDADLATPLEEIDSLSQVLLGRNDIDVVMGSRIPLLGRSIQRNRWRAKLSRVFSFAATRVLRFPVFDTQCGAKLFRVTRHLKPVLERPFLSRWIFDVELLSRLMLATGQDRKRFYEMPLNAWEEVAGSKLRARHFLIAPLELWRIHSHYSGKKGSDFLAEIGLSIDLANQSSQHPPENLEKQAA